MNIQDYTLTIPVYKNVYVHNPSMYVVQCCWIKYIKYKWCARSISQKLIILIAVVEKFASLYRLGWILTSVLLYRKTRPHIPSYKNDMSDLFHILEKRVSWKLKEQPQPSYLHWHTVLRRWVESFLQIKRSSVR